MDNNEAQSFSEMLRHYLAIFWHWGWLLILTTVLAGGAAYLTSRVTIPVYQASTLILVNPAPASTAQDYTSLITGQALAQTYVQLVTARPILEGVITKLGLSIGPDDLIKDITAEVVGTTQLIQIKVEDTDPIRAAQIANTLVTEFSDQNMTEQASRYSASKQSLEGQLTQLDQQIQSTNMALSNLGSDPSQQSERDQLNLALSQYQQSYANLLQSYEQLRLAETQSISTIVQKEPAIPPDKPIRPKTMRDTILAMFVGLMLGAGIVFLIEAMDDTLKGPEEIARQLGLPVLGIIAAHGPEKMKLITINESLSPVTEAFRSLRTNLQFASVDNPLHSVLVTSPSPDDGKSTIAGNLAVIMAQAGRQVVVLDADLRKPSLHMLFRVPNRTGFSSLFTATGVSPDGNLRNTEVTNLKIMTSGELPPNPSELLGSEKMTKILEQAGNQFDFIVVDSPPLLAVTDAAVLAPKVDGVLLVIKPGVSKLQACKHAVEQLKMVGAHILGVVLNDVKINSSSYYKGYYKDYKYHSNKKGDRSLSSKPSTR
jgi:capsular exopolysaccharide synthesis family protein